LWQDKKKIPPDEFKAVKYDLVRISYDIEKDDWGTVETVISSKDTHRSIAMPQISPDGRWLIFCMCDYGFFPPWQQSSDLYIADLEAGEKTGRFEYRRLDINSDQSESWLSWSSNSRWVVFSSKREFGDFTRSYLSYVDEDGIVYKPFVLPQEDPGFYNYCTDAFNTPEFSIEPIAARGNSLARVVHGSSEIEVEVPITMATPKGQQKPEWGQDLQIFQN